MPPIELAVSFGASVSKWRRIFSSLTLAELLQKIRLKVSARIFRWYEDALGFVFDMRNLVTSNAIIKNAVGGVEFGIMPDGITAFRVWSGLRFERRELEFILRTLQPGMTFFDAGAGVGLFSVAAGRKFRDQACKIFAFEGCQSTFAILEENLLANRLTAVRAINLALCRQTGQTRLCADVESKRAGNSHKAIHRMRAAPVSKQSMQVITVDEFIAKEHIARVDVMRVDADGGEMCVLNGARKLLERADAPVILCRGDSQRTAAYQYHPVELMWQLETFGYELFNLEPDSARVRRREPAHGYDAILVAAKKTHCRYKEMFLGEETA